MLGQLACFMKAAWQTNALAIPNHKYPCHWWCCLAALSRPSHQPKTPMSRHAPFQLAHPSLQQTTNTLMLPNSGKRLGPWPPHASAGQHTHCHTRCFCSNAGLQGCVLLQEPRRPPPRRPGGRRGKGCGGGGGGGGGDVTDGGCGLRGSVRLGYLSGLVYATACVLLLQRCAL
jgi:hypothetical protein